MIKYDYIFLLYHSSLETLCFGPPYTDGVFILVRDGALAQSAVTCLKLTIETLEKGVKYVQS